MARYDVVVIGAGHNGLVAATYLARAGAHVLVLEQRPLVGGACITEEAWPGFRINTFSYVAGLLRPEIVRELELEKHGYRAILYDPQAFVPYPDGRSLRIWNDEARTVNEISKFSKKDAQAYPKFDRFWEDVLDLVEPLLLAPPVPLAELLGTLGGPEAERLLRDLFLMSAQDFLDEWFESDEVKISFATNAVIGEMVGPRTPGTAYVLAHHNIGIIDGVRKVWGFSQGGMGRITEALAKAARAAGATIRTGVRVARIVVEKGKAVGVETGDGMVYRAPAIASNADAKNTFLRLAPVDAFDPEFLRQVRRIRSRGAALKFNAALDRLPSFRASPGAPAPHHQGACEIAPSMDYLEHAFDQGKYGRFSEHPFCDTVFQSALDPTVAPPGKHTMTCFVQYAPRELVGTTWKEFKPQAGEIVLDTLEEFAPDIRKVVRHWQVISPEDIENTLGMSGGNIFQGDITPDQIFGFRPVLGWAQYRTPLPGLYLCGSSAHPGGGVTGAPGHNAAQTILEDWKKTPPV